MYYDNIFNKCNFHVKIRSSQLDLCKIRFDLVYVLFCLSLNADANKQNNWDYKSKFIDLTVMLINKSMQDMFKEI